MKNLFVFALLLLGHQAGAQVPGEDNSLHDRAVELAHKFIIADGHVDLPSRLYVKNFRLTKEFTGIPIESKNGDFDYVRARAGGLDAPFMSIYVPSSMQLDGDPKAYADSLINMIHHIIAAHPDKFAKGESPDEIEANFKKGLLSLPLGMENGAPIREIADLAYFFNRGIRYITLTHASDNQICDSSYDTSRTWNGLSTFGRTVVEEMNRQGIMIDISHVTDAAFYQVIGLTRAPVIASHSSCRRFTPDFQRNMSDDMIKALGKNGGIIMINFGSDFLDSRVKKTREEVRVKWLNALAEKNLQEGEPEAAPIVAAFKQEYHTQLFSDVEMVADHIDHAVKLAGVEHVGLGSDFDGVGDSLPLGLKDVSAFPNLIEVLLRRGYSEQDIEKICWKNLARVWREVELVAAEMR